MTYKSCKTTYFIILVLKGLKEIKKYLNREESVIKVIGFFRNFMEIDLLKLSNNLTALTSFLIQSKYRHRQRKCNSYRKRYLLAVRLY